MSAKETIVKFECPNCHGKLEGVPALQYEIIPCPHCGSNIHPKLASLSEPSKANSLSEPSKANYKIQSLRKTGDTLIFLAIVCGILGIIFAFLAINNSINPPEDSNVDWTRICIIAFGCAWAIGLWLYLVAQIVHIRANTTK